MTAYLRSDLSPTAKRALIVLLEEGHFTLQAQYWVASSGGRFLRRTIESLYDRYLVKIVVESRHRTMHVAKLTPIGEYAAREIKRDMDLNAAASSTLQPAISEQAALLIQGIVS